MELNGLVWSSSNLKIARVKNTVKIVTERFRKLDAKLKKDALVV
jgi:hypothetical protein